MILTDEQQRRLDEALKWSRKPPGDVIYDGPYSQVEIGKLHAQKLITIIRELAEAELEPKDDLDSQARSYIGTAKRLAAEYDAREKVEREGLGSSPPFGDHSSRCDDARPCSFRENGYCTICCLRRDSLIAELAEKGGEADHLRAALVNIADRAGTCFGEVLRGLKDLAEEAL